MAIIAVGPLSIRINGLQQKHWLSAVLPHRSSGAPPLRSLDPILHFFGDAILKIRDHATFIRRLNRRRSWVSYAPLQGSLARLAIASFRFWCVWYMYERYSANTVCTTFIQLRPQIHSFISSKSVIQARTTHAIGSPQATYKLCKATSLIAISMIFFISAVVPFYFDCFK